MAEGSGLSRKEAGYQLLTRDWPAIVDSRERRSEPGQTVPVYGSPTPWPRKRLGCRQVHLPERSTIVYVHDTNHRDLFDHRERTFSSGCVRVRDPLELAARLLSGQGDWTRAKIDEVVASGETMQVNLERRLPILMAYTTAFAIDGKVTLQTRRLRARTPGCSRRSTPASSSASKTGLSASKSSGASTMSRGTTYR